MKRRLARSLATAVAVAALLPPPAAAQAEKLIPAAVGGVIGVGAGGYVALGIIALKARHGRYLFGLDDAFGWESAAVLAGGATGVVLGAWDQDRLRNATFGSIGAGLVGTGIGALVGRRIWPPPEGKWAGGVIGGGLGVLVGAGVGGLMPPRWLDESAGGVPVMIRVPVGP